MIPLNRVKIDSFRLLIPIEFVTILDETFNKNVVANVFDDGTIEDLETPTKIQPFKKITGITCRFAIQHLFDENRQQRTYVAVIVNAKMLKQEYFNGIDKTNIHKAFKFINDTGIIQVSKEDFLSAKVVDVDFCVDVLLQDTTCKELVQTAYQLAIPRKDIQIGQWTQKTNTGIQFGNRQGVGKAYEKKQFLKYYAKLVSLKYDDRNTEFYETYVKDIINEKTLFADGEEYSSPFTDDNFLRMETTLKNAAHFATYSKEVKTLKDLLKLDIGTDYSYFRRPQANYMTSFKLIKHNEKLTLTDKSYLFNLEMTAKFYSLKIEDAVPYVVNQLCPHNTTDKNLKQKRNQLKNKLQMLLMVNKKKMLEAKKKADIQKAFEFEKNNLIPS